MKTSDESTPLGKKIDTAPLPAPKPKAIDAARGVFQGPDGKFFTDIAKNRAATFHSVPCGSTP